MAGDASAASHFCSGTGSEWRDVMMQGAELATIHSSVQQAAALCRTMVR